MIKRGKESFSGYNAPKKTPSHPQFESFAGTVNAPLNGAVVYVNGRACSAGEAASFTLTIGASQTLGRYVLLILGTTTSGEIIKRRLLVDVGAE